MGVNGIYTVYITLYNFQFSIYVKWIKIVSVAPTVSHCFAVRCVPVLGSKFSGEVLKAYRARSSVALDSLDTGAQGRSDSKSWGASFCFHNIYIYISIYTYSIIIYNYILYIYIIFRCFTKTLIINDTSAIRY